MKTAEEIVQEFIKSNYKHNYNIPNNRVFYTDNSCSTLVHVENNVVIEYYYLFPNKETPIHTHPFKNQMIYVMGDLKAYRCTEGAKKVVEFNDSLRNYVSTVMGIGDGHGFTVGPKGAIIYNIQIWPDTVTDPASAAIHYKGTPMGPLHQQLIKQ